ncbi:YciI family protein [Actinoplanes sp. NPDC051475]|uniref:YciI family protein n=1 Tax=Actinoplanes sp. NPDC051475 TaxID=3157225 RepID=UPI003450B1C8
MISKYLAPLDEVDRARDDHLAFLAGLEERGLLVSAGRQDPAVGGVVLLGVDSEAEARELMAQDPYLLRGLAEYSAIGWAPTRGVLAGWKPA